MTEHDKSKDITVRGGLVNRPAPTAHHLPSRHQPNTPPRKPPGQQKPVPKPLKPPAAEPPVPQETETEVVSDE